MVRALAWVVTRLRWLVVPAWVAGAVFLFVAHPGFEAARSTGFSGILPEDAPPVAAQVEAVKRFGFPVLSRVAVVHRDPDGLSIGEQLEAVARAVQITRGEVEGLEDVAGAVPVLNTGGVFPTSKESGTTVVTYLFSRPEVPAAQRIESAHELIERHIEPEAGEFAGVTGAAAARERQGQLINGALSMVELGTVGVVALVVGLVFRSLVAPLIALTAAGMAYVASTRLLVWGSNRFDIALPGELEPLIVVLLVGVLTDYAIFFLADYRRRLRDGDARPVDAAQAAAAGTAPVVLTAALIVAGGTGALMVADLELYARLGPGMAVAVLVGAVVAVTFVPAAMALFGRATFWPSSPADHTRSAMDTWRGRMARLGAYRPAAALVIVMVVGGLVYVAGQGSVRLGANLISGLPDDAEPAVAARQAAEGFAPGIIAPLEIVVTGSGVADQEAALTDLQELLEGQPGVEGVLGPAQQPLPQDFGLFKAPGGDAARFVALLGTDPYSARAIDVVSDLQSRLPQLVDRAGLGDAEAVIAGDTAIAELLVDKTRSDFLRIAAATLAVDLLLLILFLRSLVAPVLVMAASVLVVITAVSITSIVDGPLLGADSFTFYVPVAVAVLLVSFGSDYNILVVSRIWRRAEDHRVREAIATGSAEASRAVAAAGVALALSFTLLALVPLQAFRQFAIAMAIGVLLDTFVIRTWLVPALLTMFGIYSAWPNERSLICKQDREDVAAEPYERQAEAASG